jgi:hypothetical protein
MPWKNDLAKLKQQLKEDPPAPPPPVMRKPVVPLGAGPSSIADEDALFLSAMGLKKPQPIASSPVARVEPQPLPPVAAAPVPAEEDFASAMSDLKGLKPLGTKIPTAAPAPAKPAPAPAPPAPVVEAATVPSVVAPVAAPPIPAPEPSGVVESAEAPSRIQLAAGMAIEVDGHLDLRGHSRSDAIERLRDRLEDARFMNWRSLHVTLGNAPELHEALLAFLEGPGPTLVHHFAQAPIPMGGAQAWILYLTA